MRIVALAWVVFVLGVSELLLSGCGRTECAAPDDLSGVWRGEYRTEDGESADLELRLEQDGNVLGGSFSLSTGGMGTLRGLRIAKRIEFEAKQTTTGCAGNLRGLANICGEAMALTLNGSDCRGDKRGRASLERQRTVIGAAGSPAGGGGSPADGGQPPARCPSVNDGTCDEPEGSNRCPDGSDPDDCRPVMMPFCASTEDGKCDEPQGTGLCPENSDFFDCLPPGTCPFSNNGVCDEPEGTARCDEGTDRSDCGAAFYCNSMPCSLPDAPPLDPTGRSVGGCCAGPYTCGFTLGAGCYQVVGGMPNPVCSEKLAAQWPGGGMGLSACCRPDGRCGLALEGLGCVVPEALYALPAIDIPNFNCTDIDADAGTTP